MTRDGESSDAAHAAIRGLIAAKLKYLVPMTIIFTGSYIGLNIMGGFARDLLATKVVGSINLGFVLIACNYILAWVLAVVYVRLANNVFDPKAREAAATVSNTGAAT